MIPDLEKAGRLKPLPCGEPHKKIWGFDGYSEQGHWCNGIVSAFTPASGRPSGYKADFWGMPPQPKNGTAIGATSDQLCKPRLGW
jgi:hypothetical protein